LRDTVICNPPSRLTEEVHHHGLAVDVMIVNRADPVSVPAKTGCAGCTRRFRRNGYCR
jgi:hypothetical protein